MAIKPAKFSPEFMLSTPRRSSGIPNSSGSHILYTVSQYSFKAQSQHYAIEVLNLHSGDSITLANDNTWTSVTWLSEREIVFVKSEEHSSTLMFADATVEKPKPQPIHTFNAKISNVKVKHLGNGTIALACTAPTTSSGAMHNPAQENKHASSARVYNELYVRHWDHYVGKHKDAVWYGALTKKGEHYELQRSRLVNALASSTLESPVPPFGDASDFDISPYGLVFVSRDPEVNPALYTKTDLYYVPLKTFTEDNPPPPRQIRTGGLNGYTGFPIFSNGGKGLVFKRMKNMQYESDKWRLMLVPDVEDLSNVQEFYKTENGKGGWDLSPDSIVWSNDDKFLFVNAEKEGRVPLFKLPSTPLEARELPQQITTQDSVADFFELGGGRLFLNSNSFIDNSLFAILDVASKETSVVSSLSDGGREFGLSPEQLDEFWFSGAGNYKCHALVVKPSQFDPNKRYPLAMLIHGGPQGSWSKWSYRWNPAVFAEQGYTVVLPNPTGSTGYGQDLVDGIAGEWGGRPYNDLVNCFEHVADNLQYADTENAVALGASYGGYMINWIQGQPLGRKFKALVCHDGIFSTKSFWSTEELYFPIHDMGGTLMEHPELYDKWDPSLHSKDWQTPQLIIHSQLDYRISMAEGLAAFNTLQSKGVPSKLLMFPDENHFVGKPENSLVWHQVVLGWINHYTGLDAAGLSKKIEDLYVVN